MRHLPGNSLFYGGVVGKRRMSDSVIPKITVLSDSEGGSSHPNRRLYLALAGGVLAALMAGGSLKLWQYRSSALATDSDSPPGAETLADGSVDEISEDAVSGDGVSVVNANFSAPFVAASPSLTLADPALLQSTSAQTRVPTIVAGRPDPFSPLVIPPRPQQALGVVSAPPPPPTPMAVPVAQPAPAPSLPAVPIAATQHLPPLPTVTIPNLPVPPIPGGFPLAEGADGAMAPNPVLLSAVDQITVSGVVQIGQQVHAIVTEPGNPSGRRVAQGDMVAGGQVRVKAIDLSSSDPTVVLTYNGRDYYRAVGRASSR